MNARADASPATGFSALDRLLRNRVLDQLRALRGRAIVLADPLGCIRTGDAEDAAAPLRIDVHGPGFYRALAANGSTDQAAIDKGVQYILSCVHEDGSIFREPSEQRKGGGLANYNTAICMVALHAVGKPEFTPVILKARKFIAGTQHMGGDDYRGGMGYDPETGRPYADLSNTYIAYEAMRLTENVEDLRASGDQRGQILVVVPVAVAQPRAVDDHRVVQQRPVLVTKTACQFAVLRQVAVVWGFIVHGAASCGR